MLGFAIAATQGYFFYLEVPKYNISQVRSVIESLKALPIGHLFRHGFTKCCTKRIAIAI
jgi:hypothetical protein